MEGPQKIPGDPAGRETAECYPSTVARGLLDHHRASDQPAEPARDPPSFPARPSVPSFPSVPYFPSVPTSPADRHHPSPHLDRGGLRSPEDCSPRFSGPTCLYTPPRPTALFSSPETHSARYPCRRVTPASCVPSIFEPPISLSIRLFWPSSPVPSPFLASLPIPCRSYSSLPCPCPDWLSWCQAWATTEDSIFCCCRAVYSSLASRRWGEIPMPIWISGSRSSCERINNGLKRRRGTRSWRWRRIPPHRTGQCIGRELSHMQAGQR